MQSSDKALELLKLHRQGYLIYRTRYPGYWVYSKPFDQDSDKLSEDLQEFMDELEPLTKEQQDYIDKVNESNARKVRK